VVLLILITLFVIEGPSPSQTSESDSIVLTIGS
jgi:hypothetical protein